jgi:hypothetical protein
LDAALVLHSCLQVPGKPQEELQDCTAGISHKITYQQLIGFKIESCIQRTLIKHVLEQVKQLTIGVETGERYFPETSRIMVSAG